MTFSVTNSNNTLINWVNSKPIPDVIDTFTYDISESDNPFRQNYTKQELSPVAKNTKLVGAEVFSAFTNPYYLTHKIIHIPTYYQTAVSEYNKLQNSNFNI